MPNDPSTKGLANLENTGVRVPIPTYEEALKRADPSGACAVTTARARPVFPRQSLARAIGVWALTLQGVDWSA